MVEPRDGVWSPPPATAGAVPCPEPRPRAPSESVSPTRGQRAASRDRARRQQALAAASRAARSSDRKRVPQTLILVLPAFGGLTGITCLREGAPCAGGGAGREASLGSCTRCGGCDEPMHRVHAWIGCVPCYRVGWACRAGMADVRATLGPVCAEQSAMLTRSEEIAELLHSIESYRDDRIAAYALKRLLLVLARPEGLRQIAAASAPAIVERSGSDPRGVACAAKCTRRVTTVRASRPATRDRESAQRPVRSKAARVLSGTVRGAVREDRAAFSVVDARGRGVGSYVA